MIVSSKELGSGREKLQRKMDFKALQLSGKASSFQGSHRPFCYQLLSFTLCTIIQLVGLLELLEG